MKNITTFSVKGKKLVAEIDHEENSIDIALIVNNKDIPITFNLMIADDNMVKLRKWVGFGADGEEELISIEEAMEV